MVEQDRFDAALDGIDEEVVAANVRHFVGENGAQLEFGEPGDGCHWKQHDRTEPPHNRRCVDAGVEQQSDRLPDAETRSDIIEYGDDRPWDDCVRQPHQTS
jgi:hypothetical protein